MNHVTNIEIVPNQLELKVGEEEVLEAFAKPDNATCKGIIWYSKDTNIVRVNQYSGLVFAIREGETSVIAQAADGSNITSQITVLVTL